MKNKELSAGRSEAQREVSGFIAWAREFIETVQDGGGVNMTDEFWDQLGALEYAVVRKPEYVAHSCISPCEEAGGRCVYPKNVGRYESRRCLKCQWVQ